MPVYFDKPRVCPRYLCSAGRESGVEAMEHEEVFFVTFVVFLVSMIALRKEKGNMGRRAGACVEENGSASRSMES